MSTQFSIYVSVLGELEVDERSSNLNLGLHLDNGEFISIAQDLPAAEMRQIALKILYPCMFNNSDPEVFKEETLQMVKDLY